jgi:hypothetical protein
MSDPTASLQDRTGLLCAALMQWSDGNTAADMVAAKRAGSAAIDAIDALLRDLYTLRGRLVWQVRQLDTAAGHHVA